MAPRHASSPTRDDTRLRRVVAPEELRVGTHLVTPRLFYWHHGIYVGGGQVVHYAGLSRALVRGPVERVSLAHFADGRALFDKAGTDLRFAPAEVVERALSRLGEDRYRLRSNNCEHFCEWCRTGESRSEQIERIVRPLRVVVQVALRWTRAMLDPRPVRAYHAG